MDINIETAVSSFNGDGGKIKGEVFSMRFEIDLTPEESARLDVVAKEIVKARIESA